LLNTVIVDPEEIFRGLDIWHNIKCFGYAPTPELNGNSFSYHGFGAMAVSLANDFKFSGNAGSYFGHH
jgi:hypothetical protein